MKKRLLAVLLTATMLFSLTACGSGQGEQPKADNGEKQEEAQNPEDGKEKAKFHIGIVTGTQSQAEDEIRGAEAMVEKYGDADKGGMIKHLTYPDDFDKQQEQVISIIAGLADDPEMKAVIVTQAVPGTAPAFEQIHEKNPDIECIAITSQEDPQVIEDAADMVIDPDNYNRGYLMVAAAKKMGAKNFVHISFPRHMAMEKMQIRADIMQAACDELGLKFYKETAPDPLSDMGVPGAKQFILEHMPKYVEQYGKDTAFFCTNDAQTEPLLKKVAELGAIFVEADLPSPIMGYPAAFDIDLKNEAGNWPEIMNKIEEVVVEKGGSGRMGTWARSYAYSAVGAATQMAIDSIENGTDLVSLDTLIKDLNEYTPGTKWNGNIYVNRTNGEKVDNHLLIYQDTYVFGKGNLGMTEVEIPEKYKTMK